MRRAAGRLHAGHHRHGAVRVDGTVTRILPLGQSLAVGLAIGHAVTVAPRHVITERECLALPVDLAGGECQPESESDPIEAARHRSGAR